MRIGVRDDRGSATMVATGLMMLLTFALAVGLVVVQVVATHRAAQNAADLAALAGAGQVQEGASPCAPASAVASLNGAVLTSCAQQGEEVLVSVEVRANSILGLSPHAVARARAGPVAAGPAG
jgi:secretion/DNA translocation related TadE-like protein